MAAKGLLLVLNYQLLQTGKLEYTAAERKAINTFQSFMEFQ